MTENRITRKIFLICNGCQRRSLEASKLSDYFIANQLKIVKTPKSADTIIFVSCALDKFHEKESFRLIRRYSKWKKEFYILGCLPEIIPIKFRSKFGEAFRDRTLPTSRLDEIGKFFPEFTISFSEISEPHRLYSNYNLFSRAFKNFNPLRLFSVFISPRQAKNKLESIIKINKLEKSEAAYFCISYGCPNACTYCAKTRAFGNLKSKPLEHCIQDYKNIMNNGVTRIAFTADDTGSYGLDINSNFYDLLKSLAKENNENKVEWIFKNLHPKWIIKYKLELLPFIKNGLITEIVCPIESGSDQILSKMNRNYKISDLTETINEFRKSNPDLLLRTHVMIGFPGETEDDFDRTLYAIKAIGFSWVTFFRYYDAEGTEAESMNNKISEDIIRIRIKKMKKFMQKNKIHWL